jgi:hypothetical protein
MNKNTVIPVEIDFKKVEITELISKYTCPVCGNTFEGTVLFYTTQFICDCGQELRIVLKE